MTAPAIRSCQHSGSTLYLIFDRAVSVTPASELVGFTFTLTLGGVITPTYSSTDNNALIITMAAPVGADTLTVVYNGLGTVVDAATGLDSAVAFNKAAVAYYVASRPVRAVAGENANNEVIIYFDEPVDTTTGDLKVGLTITVDAVPLVLTSATATLNADQTQLTIGCVSDFSYTNVVAVSYTSTTGKLYTWPSGTVASFSLAAINNLSTDGLPSSSYPLSIVTKYPLTIAGNVVTAKLGVSLNPVDITLVAEYGEVSINTGGTYGSPYPISILGSTITIIDGGEYTQDFTYVGHTSYAAVAALAWRDAIATTIGIKLGELRLIDAGVSKGANVYEQV